MWSEMTPLQLGTHRGSKIHFTIGRHLKKQNRHIGHLGFDFGTAHRNPLVRLLRILTLPHKSDPDGAASLPWQTIALARGSVIRANWEGSSSSHDPRFSRNAASRNPE